jgi:hypothetical protein
MRSFSSAPVFRLLVPALAAAGLVAACDLSEGTKYGNTPPSSANLPKAPDDQPVEGGVSGCDGGTPDAGPCTVSFANVIWPNLLSATGKGACASQSCHGGTTAPMFQDAPSAYTALQSEITAGKPYINKCSTDTAASGIYCNLGGGGMTCGTAMPLPPGQQFSTTDLDQIKTWVQCGAPNN